MSGVSLVADILSNAPTLFHSEALPLWVRSAPSLNLFKQLKARAAAVNWTVQNGTIPAYSVAEGSDVATAEYNVDDKVKMTLNRGIYRAACALSHTEIATANLFGADTASSLIFDLVQNEWVGHLCKLARTIEIDAATGTGSTTNSPSGGSEANIVGWQSFMGSSGSYAGQSFNFASSENPGLASYVKASVGNLSRTVMDQALAYIDGYSQLPADFIMAGPITCSYVKAIGDNQIRYFSPEQMVREVSGIGRQAATGLANSICSYAGIPVIQNNAWSAQGANLEGTVLIGRRDDIALDVLPYGSFGDAVVEEDLALMQGASGMLELIGMPVKSYSVAKSGASVKFAMEIELQEAVLRPNAFAVLSGVTGASVNSA
jgi:hypothetical protein